MLSPFERAQFDWFRLSRRRCMWADALIRRDVPHFRLHRCTCRYYRSVPPDGCETVSMWDTGTCYAYSISVPRRRWNPPVVLGRLADITNSACMEFVDARAVDWSGVPSRWRGGVARRWSVLQGGLGVTRHPRRPFPRRQLLLSHPATFRCRQYTRGMPRESFDVVTDRVIDSRSQQQMSVLAYVSVHHVHARSLAALKTDCCVNANSVHRRN